MTEKEAFKIGFLLKCAEEGLAVEQVESRIQQRASSIKKEAVFGGIANLAGRGLSLAGTAVDKAFWPAMLAPPLLGIAGAYGLSKAKDDTYDVDEAKKREEIAAYRRAIDQLKRSRRKRDSF